MKLTVYFLLALLLAPVSALAVDIDVTSGLYYFTSDGEKVAAAETESAENSLKFRTTRDPRAIARDLALAELQSGNVCLSQAEQDLAEAVKKKQVLKLCKQLFKEEADEAIQRSVTQKLKPDYLRCSANVEAHERGGSLRMILSFRAQLVVHEKVPTRLKKGGFAEEPKGWALPTHEAPLGDNADGWKGVLKNGSCVLDDSALAAFLDRYLKQLKEAKALAHCRKDQVRQIDQLDRLQKQFKTYVPDDWLKEVGNTKVQRELFRPAPAVDIYAGLAECRHTRQLTKEQLSDLREVAARMASKHDVPALDPENQPGAREPASDDDEF
ncbi:MAG TPA: hypothetical protein VIH99_04705 [Bdellovibrionota bacterium]|jgi:hypothetical protein